MLRYQHINLTRPQLTALAGAAKAGDRDAFDHLIRGTIRLYRHIVNRLRTHPALHDDLIQDAILHTWEHVLPAYDPALPYVHYAGRAIGRRMIRHFRQIAGPVTVASADCYTYAIGLPEHAQGVVEPTRCRSGYVEEPTPSALDVIERQSTRARVQEELRKLTRENRIAVLYDGPTAADMCGISRQAVNQRKHKTEILLYCRLFDCR